jgi:hypothetical protein
VAPHAWGGPARAARHAQHGRRLGRGRYPVETLRKIETGRIATPAFFTVAALAYALELDLSALAHTLDGLLDVAPNAATA